MGGGDWTERIGAGCGVGEATGGFSGLSSARGGADG
jgi:hypothetical protein